jgi:hypothetical protein
LNRDKSEGRLGEGVKEIRIKIKIKARIRNELVVIPFFQQTGKIGSQLMALRAAVTEITELGKLRP